MLSRVIRRATLCLALALSAGCVEHHQRTEQKSHRVRVRAPFTSVDVDVPTDEPEETNVRVEVDD
jgi:hypothetical protein